MSQQCLKPSMLVVGYGEAQPLLENTSAANKARNRRIEFSALN